MVFVLGIVVDVVVGAWFGCSVDTVLGCEFVGCCTSVLAAVGCSGGAHVVEVVGIVVCCVAAEHC